MKSCFIPPPFTLPSIVQQSGVTACNNGVWTQLIASSNALSKLIQAFLTGLPGAGSIQLGTGAAGFEAAFYTFNFDNVSNINIGPFLFKIPQNTRIAANPTVTLNVQFSIFY